MMNHATKQKTLFAGAILLVIALLVMLVFLVKAGLDMTVGIYKDSRTICIDCHKGCEKPDNEYSKKCLNCHEEIICYRGLKHQANSDKDKKNQRRKR